MKHDQVCEYIRSLFPRSKWQAGEWAFFMERMGRLSLDAEQGKAVVGEYKAGCSYATPDASAILARMETVHRVNQGAATKAVMQAKPAHNAGSEPGPLELEAIRRFGANPSDKLFDRLRWRHKHAGTLDMARRQWRAWSGGDGPYAPDLCENIANEQPPAPVFGVDVPVLTGPVEAQSEFDAARRRRKFSSKRGGFHA